MAADPSSVAAAPVPVLDPEAEFLASKREMGNEWELFKENVRPLKRGRNVQILNEALKSQHDNLLRQSLLGKRRKMIEAIDEYRGEDPLQPWLECIKWVQESFPAGGEASGLLVIYEQCVRTFWHEERYKNDLRYLKVWLEYAEGCSDAEVIYRFLEANEIGQTHAIYYISYAVHMDSKNKLNKADEIFSIGIARRALPLEKLETAYRKFIVRLAGRSKTTEDETVDDQPVRSFGTILATGETRRLLTDRPDVARKKAKVQRPDSSAPFSIYNDARLGPKSRNEPPKSDLSFWHTLGTQPDRNKENTSIPSKWTSYKVPQKTGFRAPAIPAPTTCIEVFVDEECADLPATETGCTKRSLLKLRRANSQNLKKDSELLKENPLRNFPPNSLPR